MKKSIHYFYFKKYNRRLKKTFSGVSLQGRDFGKEEYIYYITHTRTHSFSLPSPISFLLSLLSSLKKLKSRDVSELASKCNFPCHTVKQNWGQNCLLVFLSNSYFHYTHGLFSLINILKASLTLCYVTY